MQNDSVKFKKKYGSKGYTLMEMVVAIAIFVIVMTAITGVFLAILRVQRKTAAMQAVQQDARWAIETMARYARMKRIDYATQADFTPANNLYLCVDSDCDPAKDIVFKIDTDDYDGDGKYDELIMSTNGGTDWSDITPKKVEVIGLKFYIAPTENPYDPGEPYEQSRVTILMKTRYAGARPEEEEVMTLQTTVSTRAYTR